MKILIINSLYYPNESGGAEKSVRILAEGLAKRGHSISVLSTSNSNYENVINGVKVFYRRHNNLYWLDNSNQKSKYLKPFWHIIDSYNPMNRNILSKVISKVKPDLVHTNNLGGFSVSILGTIKSYKIPIVHTPRDYYLLCYKNQMFKKYKNCKKQCISCNILSFFRKNILPRHINAFIPASKFMLQKHQKFIRLDGVIKQVIVNAYGLKSPKKINNLHRNGELVFGYIGSLSVNKGIENVIKSFNRMDFSDCRLLIAGRGKDEYEAYLRKIAINDKIEFLGFIPAHIFYEKVDIVVVPSLWEEPIPRSIIESYAFNKPVIASNRGGIPEIMINYKTGILYNPVSSNNFEKAINWFLENKSEIQEMKCNIKKNFKHFNQNLIIDNWLSLYKMVIKSYNGS